ncbi:MAG: peptide chain release factor 2 [Clostridia bacterium]|nr:peptide chain release factor 2 [Clostridia bacterium]
MIQLDDINVKLTQAQSALTSACAHRDPEGMRTRLSELEEAMGSPSFWDDAPQAQRLSSEASTLQSKLSKIENLKKLIEDAREWAVLAEEMDDQAMFADAQAQTVQACEQAEALYLQTLLRGEYDSHSAYLAIHAGAGGTEAQDWAQMVLRMYQRFCERQGYKVSMLDLQDGDEAGIKSAELFVEGENAYGYLKSEKGVHRLVRISPFDANARRHTSFCSLDVMPDIPDAEAIPINAEDLRVDTYRSSGAGGQHVNKTDSAIRITHIPTGIVVSCQTQRSQMQNREYAMAMLRARLAEVAEREQAEKIAEVKGELKKIEWGSQIRSYVLHPYSMVNDHRTGEKTAAAQGVLDGDLMGFVNAWLRKA